MARFLILLVVLGVIGAGVVEWASAAWTQPGPPAVQGPNVQNNETIFMVEPRSRVHDIAQRLQDAHVLNFALAFEFNLRTRQLADKIKAGEYAIPTKSSMADVAAILISGKSIQHKLTAAEGLTSDMIWKLVKADPVLVGDAGAAPAEGTLLPETYLFTRGTSRAELLDRMHKAQAKFLSAQWSVRSPNPQIQSMNQAVILASIVEKETALPQERRHIASVFANRLKVGMRLQSDPTIIYGLTQGYPLGRGIRESEITGATPYNTYAIAGLPPGPICNPGKDAIAAVLNPLPSDDLFFVANGKGGHVFSATISEHEHNVAAWRAVERLKDHVPDVIPDPAPLTMPALPAAKNATPRKRHRHA